MDPHEQTANSDTLPSPSYRSGTPQGSLHHQQKLQYHHQQMGIDSSQDGGGGLNPMLLETEDDRMSLMHQQQQLQRNATLMKAMGGSQMNLSQAQQQHYYPAAQSRPMQSGGGGGPIFTNAGPGYVQGHNGELIQLQPMGPSPAQFCDPNEIIYQAHPGQLNQAYIPITGHARGLRPQPAIAYDSCPAICSVFAIFCCPITLWCTVPALVYSICAYSDYTAQDWLRYRRRSDRARRLVIVACITGLVLCIIFSILLYYYHEAIIRYLTHVYNCLTGACKK